MSAGAASAVGKAWLALCDLHSDRILSDRDFGRAVGRLQRKGARLGVFMSGTDPFGKPLTFAMRVHWGGSRGQQINRVYQWPARAGVR